MFFDILLQRCDRNYGLISMKLTGQRSQGFAQIPLAPLTRGHSETHTIQFQPIFMEKDLLKLDNEPCDDDFERLRFKVQRFGRRPKYF